MALFTLLSSPLLFNLAENGDCSSHLLFSDGAVIQSKVKIDNQLR